MKFQHVCIESVAYVLPPHVVRSADLEEAIAPTLKRLGISRGIVENLTGVQERRYFDPGTRPSQAAAWAGQRALEQAGVSPSQIGVLVNGSVSRDYIEPATAALVSGQLGLGHHCLHMDVSNACLGFLNGMLVVASMIELGQIDYALVVCGETARPGVTATLQRLSGPDASSDMFRDNFATLTLGSGAAGAVLCRREKSRSGHRLNGAGYATDSSYSNLCLATPTEMRVDPAALLEHGVDTATEAWQRTLTENGWRNDMFDEIVLHQVGKAHHTHTFERCGLPLSKAPMTFPFMGNTGPGSVPITLALGVEQGRIRTGMEIALFSVGSGLGAMILGVSW